MNDLVGRSWVLEFLIELADLEGAAGGAEGAAAELKPVRVCRGERRQKSIRVGK